MLSKNETQILKGVAILLMLWLHLFMYPSFVETCQNFISICNVPFAHLLTRACNPVPFFLILGGYGMYVVCQKVDNHRISRIIKLYVHYWVVLLVFIVGSFVKYGNAPISLTEIVYNFTGYGVTYNPPMWFLLPYVLLSLTSPWLFSLTDKFKTKYVLMFLCCLDFCTSFLISRFGESFFFNTYWAYTPLLYFHLMFAFYLGAMSAKHNVFEKIESSRWGQLLPKYGWILLLLLVTLRLTHNTSVFHSFYAYCFIIVFIKMKRNKYVDKCFVFMGKHSMNIWMIHWLLYIQFFCGFIYAFKFPIVIYLVLVVMSVVSSILLNLICKPLDWLANKI